MSEQQAVVTPAPAPAPEGLPAPEVSEGRAKAIEIIRGLSKNAAPDGEDAGDDDDKVAPAPKGEAKDADPDNDEGGDEIPEAKEEKKEPEKKTLAKEERVQKIKQALEGLTDDEVAAFLGAESDAFAALTSKKRELREREERHQQRVAKFDASAKELEDLHGEFEQLLATAKNDPGAALEVIGWTLEEVAEWAANGRVPAKKLDQELREEFKSETQKLREEMEAEIRKDREALAEERAQVNIEVWEAGVARAVRALTPESHPNLAKVVRKSGGQKVFDSIKNVQRGYWSDPEARQEIAQVLEIQPVKGEPLATPDALRYLEMRLEHQRRLLLDEDELSSPVQAGSRPEGKPRHLTTRDTSEVTTTRPEPDAKTGRQKAAEMLRRVTSRISDE